MYSEILIYYRHCHLPRDGNHICQSAVSMIHAFSSEEERIKEANPNLQQTCTDRVVLHMSAMDLLSCCLKSGTDVHVCTVSIQSAVTGKFWFRDVAKLHSFESGNLFCILPTLLKHLGETAPNAPFQSPSPRSSLAETWAQVCWQVFTSRYLSFFSFGVIKRDFSLLAHAVQNRATPE